MAVLIAVGLALAFKPLNLDSWPAPLRGWVGTSPKTFGAYVMTSYTEDAADASFPPEGPALLLIGDSFSQDAYNMLREANGFADYAISAHYVPTRCQIHLHAPDVVPIAAGDSVLCDREALLRTLDMAQVVRADVIILAGRWREWAVELLPETLSQLRAAGAGRIMVLGSKSFPADIAQWRNLEDDALLQMRFDIPDGLVERNARLEELSGASRFMDPMAAICDETECPVFTPQGELISYDGAHLTQAGAAFLGNALFRSEPPHF